MTRFRLVLLALATIAAAAHAQHPGSQMKTYVSPGGDFQFRYPAYLVDCKAQPNDSSCVTYMANCEGTSGPSVACFAYPKDLVKEQQTFDGAAFLVSIVSDVHDEPACRQIPNPPPDDWAHPHTESIHGVEFWATHDGGGAMNHSNDMAVHRAFHNGLCYELDINISGINPKVYPDPPKYFDVKAVERPLRQTLNTFQFLR